VVRISLLKVVPIQRSRSNVIDFFSEPETAYPEPILTTWTRYHGLVLDKYWLDVIIDVLSSASTSDKTQHLNIDQEAVR